MIQRGDRGISASRSGLAASQPRRWGAAGVSDPGDRRNPGLGRALVTELSRLADMADLPATQRLVLDLTKPASIDQAMATAGRLKVVINNAAMTVSGPVEAVPADLVAQVLATNVLGPLRVMQAVLPAMREQGAGRIQNISSPAGLFAPPLEGVYSASKAALEMFSEAVRFEAGHFGV